MSTSSEEVLDLKRRAVALKKAGDVKGALQLLRQAKQLELQQAQQDKQTVPEKEQQQREEPTKPTEPQPEGVSQPNEEDSEKEESVGDAPSVDNDELDDLLLDDGPITFTDEEMQDCEMMTEFKLGGISVPSNEEYQAKILSTKKKALALKNAGNIAGAKQQLVCAKQLEAVRIALSHMNEGLGLRIHDDKDGWLEELSEPDSALVGNLLSKSGTVVLDLEDLDTMSPEELTDAVEMGMELPAVEDIVATANEKKSQALQFKQAGDLEGAKTALVCYKELQAAATMIESLQKPSNNDGESGEMSMEALEALLENATGAPKQQQQQQQQRRPEPKETAPSKSAEELKQETVRLRNEKKIKEATEMFKLYKVALKKENDAAEKKQVQEMVDRLGKEIVLAEQQRLMFQFYGRFVDKEVGAEQTAYWNEYIKKCTDVSKLLQKKGPKSVTISHSADSGMLYIPEENLVDFLELGMDDSEERLEVAVLDVRSVDENNAFRKLHRGKCEEENSSSCHILRVSVTVQIPPSEEERDRSVELTFDSTPHSESDSGYLFESSQYIKVPRGDSKFATTVRRRMERRKLQVAVYHVPHEVKRNGWFGSRSSVPPSKDNAPTLLGKVVLELKDLLKRNCVAGDYPLMTSTRAVGGTLAFVVRTGVPFDTEQQEQTMAETSMEKYEAMSFSLPSKK